MGIETENYEMRSMRTVQRELSGIVTELENGLVEKVVVTKHAKMAAVLITAERYEELVAGSSA